MTITATVIERFQGDSAQVELYDDTDDAMIYVMAGRPYENRVEMYFDTEQQEEADAWVWLGADDLAEEALAEAGFLDDDDDVRWI